MRSTTLVAAFLLAYLGGSQVSAATATLFGAGADSRQLYLIDLTTAARTTVTSFSPYGISGLTYNSSDGFLYATVDESSISTPHPIRYFKINPNDFSRSGILSFSGVTFGGGVTLNSLEYDPRRNGFWGISQATRELIFIDATAGQGQVVGQYAEVPQTLIGAIAYDPVSDVLYGMADSSGITGTRLVKIDRGTLALTPIGSPGLGFGFEDMDSLAWNPLDGMLYSINDDDFFGFPDYTGQLVRIDPSTGTAVLIGNPAGTRETHQGIAFVVVPEPSTVVLLILAFSAVIWRRR
jgi:uncharacterized protein YjiK